MGFNMCTCDRMGDVCIDDTFVSICNYVLLQCCGKTMYIILIYKLCLFKKDSVWYFNHAGYFSTIKSRPSNECFLNISHIYFMHKL